MESPYKLTSPSFPPSPSKYSFVGVEGMTIHDSNVKKRCLGIALPTPFTWSYEGDQEGR